MGNLEFNEHEMLREKHCRKCGKEIYVTPEWVYKDPFGWYCSWGCFNHRFDGKDGKSIKAKARKVKRVDMLNDEGEVIQTFDNVYDAALEVDGLFNAIYDMCRFYRNGIKKKYKKHFWRYADEPKDEADKDENNLTEGQ